MAKQYLEADYLVDRYLYNIADPVVHGLQWTVRVDTEKALAAQYAAKMVDKEALGGSQWQAKIVDFVTPHGLEYQAVITKGFSVGVQWLVKVVDQQKPSGVQWQTKNTKPVNIATQYLARVVDFAKNAGIAWNFQFVGEAKPSGLQYLVNNTKQIELGIQYFSLINRAKESGLQYTSRIEDYPKGAGIGWQSKILETPKAYGLFYKSTHLVFRQVAGYLELPYLQTAYLGGVQSLGAPVQWNVAVEDRIKPNGTQWLTQIDTDMFVGVQWTAQIDYAKNTGVQYNVRNSQKRYLAAQWQGKIVDAINYVGVGWLTQINTTFVPAVATDSYGINYLATPLGMLGNDLAVELIDTGSGSPTVTEVGNLVQVFFDPLSTLAQDIVDAINTYSTLLTSGATNPSVSISSAFAPLSLTGGTNPNALGMQWTVSAANKLGLQWRVIVYNINRPRVMYSFASRGTGSEVRMITNVARSSGVVSITVDGTHGYTVGQAVTVRVKTNSSLSGEFNISQVPTPNTFRYALAGANLSLTADTGDVRGHNWTASNTRIGDFVASNVNSDIVEQVWRSSDNILTATLDCDTQVPQGVFVDTIGILNHNLTRSMNILVQASNVAGNFSSPLLEIYIPWNKTNIFWVAPELPNIQARYWRFRIENLGNPDNFLQVGTIVFGSSVIFTKECFVNPIKFGRVAFADSIQTEGFTNVSNDRAVKNYVEMTFKNLDYSQGNYGALVEMFDTVRTTHKALWIPEPRYPNRYGVFGKLQELPEESHNDLGENSDWVDMSFRIDESL
jgi:hypothetical protein